MKCPECYNKTPDVEDCDYCEGLGQVCDICEDPICEGDCQDETLDEDDGFFDDEYSDEEDDWDDDDWEYDDDNLLEDDDEFSNIER